MTRPMRIAGLLVAGTAVAAGGTLAAVGRARASGPPVPGGPDHWTARSWTEHVHDRVVRGTRVRYADVGEGPVLVLLHGMGACWQWWLECLPGLAGSGRILAVDLPGFGGSEPLPVPWTMDDQASTVLALLAALGIDRAAVAGHSMGGLVAARMAQKRPDVVSRLLLIDAGGVPMSERRLRVVLRFLSVAHRNLSRPGMLGLLTRSRRARRVLLRSAMADPDTMSDALAAVVMPRLDAPGFVPALAASARAVRSSAPESIAVPTRLIWGDRDVFAPLHTAEAMLRRLPDGELSVLAGVGHSPMVEAPDKLTALLLEHAFSRAEVLGPTDRQEGRR